VVRRLDDETVVQQIRAVTNSRATYGYRRVWAMVNRTFRAGYNRKRIRWCSDRLVLGSRSPRMLEQRHQALAVPRVRVRRAPLGVAKDVPLPDRWVHELVDRQVVEKAPRDIDGPLEALRLRRREAPW
jgi:hypothetical protein